jgi:predicted ATP-dependent serine protease
VAAEPAVPTWVAFFRDLRLTVRRTEVAKWLGIARAGPGDTGARLYVLAACTSIGKTTLMMQVAHQVATQSGPVLFVS